MLPNRRPDEATRARVLRARTDPEAERPVIHESEVHAEEAATEEPRRRDGQVKRWGAEATLTTVTETEPVAGILVPPSELGEGLWNVTASVTDWPS